MSRRYEMKEKIAPTLGVVLLIIVFFELANYVFETKVDNRQPYWCGNNH